jgi:transposase InsO family protein
MLSGDHPVKLLCETLHVSRSGYYAWRSGKESLRKKADRLLSEQIQTAYLQSRSTYGSPRITASLRSQGHAVGRRRVARLMREAGLRGRQKRRYRVVTTDSGHEEPIARNLLAQRPPPRRPDEVWVTDITYLQTDEGWLYLAGVLDRCTRRLIGWAMDSQMDASLAVAALEMAVQQRQPSPGVIHHSDRGIHYACAEYRERLAVHKMVRSMSRAGNCYDNGAMEAFWSTMKNEMVYRRRFLTRAQARSAIFDYVEGFYNRTRLHSALGYKSPLDYETNLT